MSKYKLDKLEQVVENSNYIMTQEEVCERLNQQNQRIAELKKQLKNATRQVRKEVCEKIKKQIFNHFNVKNMEEYENLSLIDSLFTADAVIEMLDTILKEYQK